MGGVFARLFGGGGDSGGRTSATTGGQSGPSKVTDQDKAILVKKPVFLSTIFVCCVHSSGCVCKPLLSHY